MDIKSPIDILFSDFTHGPMDVVKLLAEYLPSMNHYSKIYIDSASTYYSSYHTLEKVVDMMNQNVIPLTLLENAKDEKSKEIKKYLTENYSEEFLYTKFKNILDNEEK